MKSCQEHLNFWKFSKFSEAEKNLDARKIRSYFKNTERGELAFFRVSVIFESGKVVIYTRSAFRVITKEWRN